MRMNFKDLLLSFIQKANQNDRRIRYLKDVDHTLHDRVTVTIVLIEDEVVLDEHCNFSLDKQHSPEDLENTICQELIERYFKIPKKCLKQKFRNSR